MAVEAKPRAKTRRRAASPVPETVAVAVIGGGPAGLMAAETARLSGVQVVVFERMPSVGRKFLLAGRGGLNLTHAEPQEAFLARFGATRGPLAPFLTRFDAGAVRAWAQALGVETFVGSSGRIFPREMKSAPLLRRWLHRLRTEGVEFRVRHRWTGFSADGALEFETPAGRQRLRAQAIVLALGGASWPHLGSDGSWQAPLAGHGVALSPLLPANCGFEAEWSALFRERYAGTPVKAVQARCRDGEAWLPPRQGEFVITRHGVEGSLIYALSRPLRETLQREGQAVLELDLLPEVAADTLEGALRRVSRGKRSLSEQWRRALGLSGVKASLLREVLDDAALHDPSRVAAALKALPLVLTATRPIEESISTAGGVRFDALGQNLALNALPDVFCAGEMIDWEAPTGGYLLTACLATGAAAGRAAAERAGGGKAGNDLAP